MLVKTGALYELKSPAWAYASRAHRAPKEQLATKTVFIVVGQTDVWDTYTGKSDFKDAVPVLVNGKLMFMSEAWMKSIFTQLRSA